MIRSSSDTSRRIDFVIPACPESFRMKERFPTSGNDRHNMQALLKSETAILKIFAQAFQWI
jgi:hypothetical protein